MIVLYHYIRVVTKIMNASHSNPTTNYYAVLANLPDTASEFFPEVIFNEIVKVHSLDIYHIIKHLNVGDEFDAMADYIRFTAKVLDNLNTEYMRISYDLYTWDYKTGEFVFKYAHSTKASKVSLCDSECLTPENILKYFKNPNGSEMSYICTTRSPMIKPSADR
jgi:hypothetical protein